jgi:hypothetical protein
MLRAPKYARLVHQTVTISDGGPHIGRDQFRRTDKVCEPVALDSRRARLVCELEGCRRVYDLRVLTAKERLIIALRRNLLVTFMLAAGGYMAQSGQAIYRASDGSQALRVLGSALTGIGVIANIVFLVWLLMSFWFWPPRYELGFVEALGEHETRTRPRNSDTYPAHIVKLHA